MHTSANVAACAATGPAPLQLTPCDPLATLPPTILAPWLLNAHPRGAVLKRRYLYVLLFSVPIVLASAVLALAVFGAAAGVLWLFVAGDNPWSSSANTILVAVFVLAFAASALALTSRAYAVGRREEAQPSLNATHVVAAVGATALLLLAIVAYQWHVGNIGARSDDVRCSEFCRGKGFAGSGMPPRNAGAAMCTCFDPQGREAVKVPMADVVPRQ